MKNSSVKEILVLTIKLLLICVVVSGLLACVNSITAPIISANEEINFNESMRELLPDANEFVQIEDLDFTSTEDGVTLNSIYKGIKDENICGYVASTVCHEGYGGDVSIMVGISDDMKVTQIKIMAMSETAGLGAKANTPEFYNQFSGLKRGIGIEKNNGGKAENNTISAISGATITSKAVTKAVNCALEAAEAGGAN